MRRMGLGMRSFREGGRRKIDGKWINEPCISTQADTTLPGKEDWGVWLGLFLEGGNVQHISCCCVREMWMTEIKYVKNNFNSIICMEHGICGLKSKSGEWQNSSHITI